MATLKLSHLGINGINLSQNEPHITPSSLCRALLTNAEICPQCAANLPDGFQLTKAYQNDVNCRALVHRGESRWLATRER